VVDRERILGKLDDMDGYLGELRSKGCRNILVLEYGHVLDEIVFETVSTRLGDFSEFKRQVLQAMSRT
jgi:uncharacterized protein YutE (UPF0331/DUF86 family)